MVVRYLDVKGVAFAPHETYAKLIIDPDTVLACSIRAQHLQLIPGGSRRSSNLAAAWSIANFCFATFRRLAGGIPWLTPVSQNSFVLLSAKVLITAVSLTTTVNNVNH